MTRPTAAALERAAQEIEHADALDAPSNTLADLLQRVIPPGPVRDAARGAQLGHPAHPMLVTVPIGAWVGSNVLDLTGGDAKAAQRLVALGNLAALPTAYTGAADWLATSGPARRLGFVHAVLNYTALGVFTASWLARRRGHRVRGAALGLSGTTVLAASGWIGGHLTYRLGVSVDTGEPEQPTTSAPDAMAPPLGTETGTAQ